jgi:integrase
MSKNSTASSDFSDNASAPSTVLLAELQGFDASACAAEEGSPDRSVALWQPRINATHLSKSVNGTWYLRLAIPDHVRARHPELPKEIRRSTKAVVKSVALAKAREMCLDFFIRYRHGATMPAPDKKSSQTFSIVYSDGLVHVEKSSDASSETLVLMQRCWEKVVLQVLGRGQRATNEPSLNGATATSATATPAVAHPAVAHPAADQSPAVMVNHTASAPVADVLPGKTTASETSLWLSDAIEDWRINGGTTFSDQTWTYSYAASFRVFRELVGDRRRDRVASDGKTEFGIRDIELYRLTRDHIAAFKAALKELPPNQGKSTADVEAWERIREGRKTKAPKPSLHSIDKKIRHIAPFILFAKKKAWIAADIQDEMELAKSVAGADLQKEESQSHTVRGSVALSDSELQKLFMQPAFLEGAKKAAWRYWIPLICLHQGARVSEASGLYSDDVIFIDGVHCLSFIPDSPESANDPDEGSDDNERRRKVMAKTGEEYRRLKNKASRRVIPIHPKLIELGFLDFVEKMRYCASRPVHLFSGLRWEDKSMFGRKPSVYMRELLRIAGIAVKRQKVPHSLRSNYNQAMGKTMLPDTLQSRLLGHSTRLMKDSKYNQTDNGPAFPFAEVLPYLAQVDFGLQLPTWKDVRGY